MSDSWIAAIVCLWLLMTVVGVAQLGLLRRVAPLLSDAVHQHEQRDVPSGLAVGETAGSFVAVDGKGAVVGPTWLRGRRRVVLFLSAGCPPCQLLATQLRAAEEPWPPGTLVVIVDHDDTRALPDWLSVLRQRDMSATVAFRAYATPQAFALDEKSTVTGAVIPAGLADLVALLSTASAAAAYAESAG